MIQSGAQILINCLVEQGVQNVFGYPGASILSVYDCLASSQIRHVLTAHEQGACFAAEGYARRSGKAGVVLATSGPGATNLVTGIADAYMDSVPLVAITGNVSLDKLGHDSFQEVDIFDMTMPVTKYSMIVKSAKDIAPAVRRAFSLAQSPRRGPVLIDIPSNVFDELADYEREIPVKAEPKQPSPDDVEKAAELIAASAKPVIYAANISEMDMGKPEDEIANVVKVKNYAKNEGSEVLVICAKTEEELSQMAPEDSAMFLEELGLEESGLNRLIKKSYELLGLISYLTAGEKETRAWTIVKGTKAPQAAGKIHSDFERGFIRAEVVDYETLLECGGYNGAREKGKVRSEGKDYVIKDGDVVLFRFNV